MGIHAETGAAPNRCRHSIVVVRLIIGQHIRFLLRIQLITELPGDPAERLAQPLGFLAVENVGNLRLELLRGNLDLLEFVDSGFGEPDADNAAIGRFSVPLDQTLCRKAGDRFRGCGRADMKRSREIPHRHAVTILSEDLKRLLLARKEPNLSQQRGHSCAVEPRGQNQLETDRLAPRMLHAPPLAGPVLRAGFLIATLTDPKARQLDPTDTVAKYQRLLYPIDITL